MREALEGENGKTPNEYLLVLEIFLFWYIFFYIFFWFFFHPLFVPFTETSEIPKPSLKDKTQGIWKTLGKKLNGIVDFRILKMKNKERFVTKYFFLYIFRSDKSNKEREETVWVDIRDLETL